MATSRQRRISVAIILGTLAFCALLLAQGATRLVAASLIKVDPTEKQAARRNPPASASLQRRRDARKITTRNIFDSRGDLEALQEDMPVASDGPLPDVDDPNATPTCSGSLRLVGAVVNPGYPEWSFAAITGSEGKAMLYRRGSSVDGSRVVAVEPAMVVMQPSNGSMCQIAMFGEEEKPTPSARAKPQTDSKSTERAARAKKDKNAGLSDEELDAGITKVSDTKFTITRSLVDKVLGNQASLMRTARVIPQEENGRVVGVKLYGVRRNSLLGRLGIQNGDMLRTINGFDMSSPDTALEAYARLRSADQLTLAMSRRGKPVNVEYNIQ